MQISVNIAQKEVQNFTRKDSSYSDITDHIEVLR